MPYVGIGWGDVEWHLEMALLTEGSFFNVNSRQGENFICCIFCHPIKNCDIYEKVNKEDCTRTNNFFAKKGWKCFLHGQPPTLASFCLYFTYKSTTGFPTNYIVIKVMHLVSVTGSQTHNLSIMSPLDRGFRCVLLDEFVIHESPPISTISVLQTYLRLKLFWCCYRRWHIFKAKSVWIFGSKLAFELLKIRPNVDCWKIQLLLFEEVTTKNWPNGPWWWLSSGQLVHLLVWRSEFDSYWSSRFFCKKRYLNKKEAEVSPLKIGLIVWHFLQEFECKKYDKCLKRTIMRN